uniref:Uncharacterized protein n=1 Tax=Arundo donax TaxID=35708 RepID=A0A0A9GE98_ARUDO
MSAKGDLQQIARSARYTMVEILLFLLSAWGFNS